MTSGRDGFIYLGNGMAKNSFYSIITISVIINFALATAITAETPRHRFTIAQFKEENLPVESAAIARNALSSRMKGSGAFMVKDSAETCADGACARRIGVADGSHHVVTGIVSRSARRIMKNFGSADKKSALADAFTVKVRVFNSFTGATEYQTAEGAASENKIILAAGNIANRILQHYEKIPVPLPAGSIETKGRNAIPRDHSSWNMNIGVSAMAARPDGSYGRFAEYGFGVKADFIIGTERCGGMRMIAGVGALQETGLMESVESSRLGLLHLGFGWDFHFSRGAWAMPHAAAGYVAHMVEGTTSDTPGGPARTEYYFDPALTAGIIAGVNIIGPLHWTAGISYTFFFEKNDTGRFASMTTGLLFEL